jgi:uncharacterized glyoxalase superfamily protein PhnB/uncharacterized damage-inducible protein DinB
MMASHPRRTETTVPGDAAPSNDERELLLNFLAQQRDGLRNAAYGLTETEARRHPSASALSVASLLRHAITTERSWISMILGGESANDQGFELTADDTVPSLLADYAEVADETARAIASVALDHPVPVPKGVPWFPDDVDAWSVRWVLLHLIEETARHAGHADIVRESIDGATCHALMAAVEGWPATDWLQPWSPGAAHGDGEVALAPPDGYHAITPWVASRDTRAVLEFVRRVFGATVSSDPVLNDDGSVGHAEVRVGDTVLALFDTRPDWQETPALLRVYVADAAAAVERAVEAGATVITRATELFFGAIVGRVRDPQGNIWWLQQHVELGADEFAARASDPKFVAAMGYVQDSLSDALGREGNPRLA